MNVFEEYQLFLPVLHDSRFAPELRLYCWNGARTTFLKLIRNAMRTIAMENDLSISGAAMSNVAEAMWKHMRHEMVEEEERQRLRFTPNKCTPETPETPHSPKEELPMPNTKAPAFETKHFVNGQDTTTLSDDELIQAIKNLETEIAKLSEVKTESKKITDKISKLDEQRAAIAKLLDSRP